MNAIPTPPRIAKRAEALPEESAQASERLPSAVSAEIVCTANMPMSARPRAASSPMKRGDRGLCDATTPVSGESGSHSCAHSRGAGRVGVDDRAGAEPPEVEPPVEGPAGPDGPIAGAVVVRGASVETGVMR